LCKSNQSHLSFSLKFQEKLDCKCFLRCLTVWNRFVWDAFSGRKSIKIAYFQPLTILEIEAVHKNKGTLEISRKKKIASAFHSIHSDITKHHGDVYPEMLHHSIHEEKKTNHFYLLETALHWLDNHDEIANFHLILLLETTKYLGFTRYFWCRYAFFSKWSKEFYTFSCR
jgi:DNA repair protein RecO (recombination protein O)